MSNIPSVSVFMITYNHEKFISAAIEGILLQKTNFTFELVIGEDCSGDKTRMICESFTKKNSIINLLPETKNNLGVNKNAERTFNECRAKYIAICEGDDYWTDPYKLQKQVDFLEDNPDYVLVHHNAKTIDEKGNLVNESNLPPANRADLSPEDLQKGKVISTLTMCFRNVIRDFPEEFYKVPIADMFLVSLLGRHGKAKYMPEIEPAMYREHSGGVWSSLNLQKRTRAKIKTWNLMAQYFKRTGDKELYEFYLKRASASFPALIKLSLQNKDFKETVDASTHFLFNNKWNEFKNFLRA
jgi:glycosyltransferase involved in cell wall biosynthesis